MMQTLVSSSPDLRFHARAARGPQVLVLIAQWTGWRSAGVRLDVVALILLVVGLPIACWLTFSNWRWKFLVEAVVACRSCSRRRCSASMCWWRSDREVRWGARGQPGPVTDWPSPSRFGCCVAALQPSVAVQPVVAAFAQVDATLLEASATGRLAMADVSARHHALVGQGILASAVPASHTRWRVRRGADGRRQPAERHARSRFDLRQRAGLQSSRRQSDRAAAPYPSGTCSRSCALLRKRGPSPSRDAGPATTSGLVASIRKRLSPHFALDIDHNRRARHHDGVWRLGLRKTTLLRCLAGLARPDAGASPSAPTCCSIPRARRAFSAAAAHRLRVSAAALFPHLSAADNIACGLAHLGRRCAASG